MRSLIYRTFTDPQPANLRTADVYGDIFPFYDCKATKNCAAEVLLVLFHAGHTALLKVCVKFLKIFADPCSPLYKEEPLTIEHLFRRCPKVLTTDPERVLAPNTYSISS